MLKMIEPWCGCMLVLLFVFFSLSVRIKELHMYFVLYSVFPFIVFTQLLSYFLYH